MAEWVGYRFDCVFESPFGEAACPRGCMKDEVVKTSVLWLSCIPVCTTPCASLSYRLGATYTLTSLNTNACKCMFVATPHIPSILPSVHPCTADCSATASFGLSLNWPVHSNSGSRSM